jgi:hypothetical protein
MPALNDLTGKIFGRLAVLSRAGSAKNGKVKWHCVCECGARTVAVGSELISGHTTSCGCWRVERNRTSSLSHGKRESPTYSTWSAMKTRCTNPGVKSYADYGGKGIKVCDRWMNSFAAFLDDMGERPAGKTLDRWPDHAGNYEPGNCRWATKEEQARNTSANVLVTFNGETLTQAEWARRHGIGQGTLSYRLRSGWTPMEALLLVPRLGLKRPPRATTTAQKGLDASRNVV